MSHTNLITSRLNIKITSSIYHGKTTRHYESETSNPHRDYINQTKNYSYRFFELKEKEQRDPSFGNQRPPLN